MLDNIKHFKEILKICRKSIGWTADYLGKRLGVTKQNISNIENDFNNLSKAQYIAIRYIFDKEAELDPERFMALKLLLDSIVDNPNSYSEHGDIIITTATALLSNNSLKTPPEVRQFNKIFMDIMSYNGVVLKHESTDWLGALEGTN